MGTLAAAALVGVSVSPAFAISAPRTLPADNTMLTTTCQDSTGSAWFLTYDVSADGTLSGLGTATDHGSNYPCTYGGAFNAVDGKFYSIKYEYTNPAYTLISVDPVTGEWIPVAAFSGDELFPESLAIAPDGTAYVTSQDVLSTLDLGTGVVTNIPGSDLGNGLDEWRIAVNPVDGKLYGIADNEGADYLWPFALIDTTDGTIDTVYAQDPQDASYYALQFDSAGTAWIVYSDPGATLESCDFLTPTTSCREQGSLMEQQTGYGTYSLMIGTPKAALPDTGVEATTAWSMGALATAALVVGGAILFVRRRANVS